MAQCAITAGWECPSCEDKWNLAGIEKDSIYLFNENEITAYAASVTGEIENLTLQPYAVGYQICVHKNSALWTEELVVSENSGNFYNQTFTFRVIDPSTTIRNSISELIDTNIVIIFRAKTGRFYLLGDTGGGLTVSVNTKETGAKSGDSTGDLITVSGESSDKAKQFFDTSESQTLANIAALL
jgi:hypothetical protein